MDCIEPVNKADSDGEGSFFRIHARGTQLKKYGFQNHARNRHVNCRRNIHNKEKNKSSAENINDKYNKVKPK